MKKNSARQRNILAFHNTYLRGFRTNVLHAISLPTLSAAMVILGNGISIMPRKSSRVCNSITESRHQLFLYFFSIKSQNIWFFFLLKCYVACYTHYNRFTELNIHAVVEFIFQYLAHGEKSVKTCKLWDQKSQRGYYALSERNHGMTCIHLMFLHLHIFIRKRWKT